VTSCGSLGLIGYTDTLAACRHSSVFQRNLTVAHKNYIRIIAS